MLRVWFKGRFSFGTMVVAGSWMLAGCASGTEVGARAEDVEPAPAAPSSVAPAAGSGAKAVPAALRSEYAGPSCVDCCPDGYPRMPTDSSTKQIAAFTPSPADVTVCPDGMAYLTLDGPDEIWRVPASGKPERYAAVSGVQPAGIACDEHGRLFVAGFSLRDGSKYSSPLLLLIDAGASEATALPQPDNESFSTPNGVTFAPGAGLYTTDTLAGVIVRTFEDEGKFHSQVVARDQLGVNGIAYDPTTRKLYISNSLSGEVSSLLVAADGSLGQPQHVWSSWEFLPMLDDLEVDEHGKLYVAHYLSGYVLRIPGEERVASVTNPASLAFRGGNLLVVDYHLNQPKLEGGLYSAPAGACGPDLFAPRK